VVFKLLGVFLRAKKATGLAYKRLITDLADPLSLKFDKIGTFSYGKYNRTNVVFAKLTDDGHKQRLLKLIGIMIVVIEFYLYSTDTVVATFEEHGLYSTDKRPPNPHLTIAKLSKYVPGVRSIQPYLYQNYINLMFGTEVVQGIELLAMSDLAEPEDGYYKVFARYP